MLIDVAGAEDIRIVTGAVFRNVYGAGQNRVRPARAFHDALRIDFPAKVVYRDVFCRTVANAVYRGARIVIDGDKVALFAPFDRGVAAERKADFPCTHRLCQRALKEPRTDAAAKAIAQTLSVFRRKGAQMIGEAYARIAIAHLGS